MTATALQKSSTLASGDTAPDFSVPDDKGNNVALSDYRGKTVVLYFYPKDDTPGCTQEAKDFQDLAAEFAALDAVVIGVSKDSTAKHEKFKTKYGLAFPLLSDTEGAVCESYGTWVEKSMYGKKYMGIDRATFLIDGEGTIREAWRKVKVKDHASAVLEAARKLAK